MTSKADWNGILVVVSICFGPTVVSSKTNTIQRHKTCHMWPVLMHVLLGGCWESGKTWLSQQCKKEIQKEDSKWGDQIKRKRKLKLKRPQNIYQSLVSNTWRRCPTILTREKGTVTKCLDWISSCNRKKNHIVQEKGELEKWWGFL